MELEERKKREIQHSNFKRQIVVAYEYQTDKDEFVKDPELYKRYFPNMKYYSVTRTSETYCKELLSQLCQSPNCRALDYCCGNGEMGVFMATKGAQTWGMDLSEVAIANANNLAKQEGVEGLASFRVMDAEALEFEDDFFDVIHEYGALHHLEYGKALSELARVVKPDGTVICTEALRHNPIIHLYRKLTPHLRTQWEAEHILGVPEIKQAKKYFAKVDYKFFHLAVLGAVPFRKLPIFSPLLTCLEAVDKVILRFPLVGRFAWISVLTLSQPKPA